METMYGVGTNPMPYIMAAYAIGMVALVGFFVWGLWSRKRLRVYLAVVHASQTKKD